VPSSAGQAVLVESVRVDGKPRQKHIAFLGSIATDRLGNRGAAFLVPRDLETQAFGKRIGPED
jgi:hypothetical protein